MIGVHTVDVTSFKQIVQSANAVPAIPVSFEANAMLSVFAGVTMVRAQEVDQDVGRTEEASGTEDPKRIISVSPLLRVNPFSPPPPLPLQQYA